MPSNLPRDAVVGIIAGGGSLPRALRDYLAERHWQVRLIGVDGEADQDGHYDAIHSIADIEGVMRSLARFGVTHSVLIGSIGRRPRLTEGRIGWRSLPMIGRIVRALPWGDDAMLRAVVQSFERRGIEVLGIHEVWPELLAGAGALGQHKPNAGAKSEIALARRAARSLGDLDVGQGAVAVGKRVIALEGLEGTDAMLERVQGLRSSGRLPAKRGGVLVKAAKPKQELRADLPTIGPDTVLGAASAGLTGIAVDAGRALVVDRDTTLRLANENRMFVWGIPDE